MSMDLMLEFGLHPGVKLAIASDIVALPHPDPLRDQPVLV
jgi:hypothetical protein